MVYNSFKTASFRRKNTEVTLSSDVMINKYSSISDQRELKIQLTKKLIFPLYKYGI